MRISRNDIPRAIDAPGAVARQALNFGDASGYATMAAEYFSMGAGADLAPLLKGLAGDTCASPHWGYLMEGEVVVTYTDGNEETIREGDLFYWPPGHSVRVNKDTEAIIFSPQKEHCTVVEHLRKQLMPE